MSEKKTKRISGGEIVLLTAFILFLMLFLLAYIYRPASKIVTKIVTAERSKPYKSMAVDYLREKYEMEAEVVDVSLDVPIEKMAIINMKSDGKEFKVIISNGHRYEVDFIADDYQYEEIEKALLDKIEKNLPGGYKYSYETSYIPGAYSKHDSVFGKDQFFDGTNLDEVMKDHTGSITMLYADTEFSDCDIFDWLQKYNMDARFVSFDSNERLNEFINYGKMSFRFEVFAPYISEIRETDKEKISNENYAIKEYDNFLYCCSENAEVSISEIDKDHFADHFISHNEDKYISNPLSKAYKFDSPGGTVSVYFPFSEIQKYNGGNCRIAWHANQGNWLDDYKLVGDYAVFNCLIGASEPEFMLVEPVEEDAVV